MPAPKLPLLPCLMISLVVTGAVQAQEVDAVQDKPTYSQLQNVTSSPLDNRVTPLFNSRASSTQGWTGQLMQEAARLRKSNVAIPGPAPDRLLRLGDRGGDVQWLIGALIARGYLAHEQNRNRAEFGADAQMGPNSEWSNGTYGAIVQPQNEFNSAVEIALRAFQADSGLSEDGIAGNAVYSSLTVDNSKLANALESWASNVATWGNQARAAGHDRMIVVNVPSFTLHAIDLTTNEEILQSRVIVGKAHTRTPLMMTRVVNLKANPDWSPPKSIRGARYQRPGPNNALGLMRFSTDNSMNIYLHDTNARGLFANDARAMSHGCIRVQQWQPLAAWAARKDEMWVEEVALVGGKTRFLKVDAIPVIITYSLADLVEGKARQFADIYNKGADAIGHAALQGRDEPGAITWTQRR